MIKNKNKKIKSLIFILFFSLNFIYFGFSATTETIRVDFDEKVSSSNYFDYYSNAKTSHSNFADSYNSENLVLYFPFNYNNISNKDDYSSNNYVFNESTGIIWNSLGCYENSGCYVFDGVTDYLEVLNSTGLEIKQDITVSAWININNFVAWAGAVSLVWDTGGSESGFSLGNVGGSNYIGMYLKTDTMPGNTWAQPSTNTLNTGQWYHIVGTYDGSIVKFYVDGEMIDSYVTSGDISYTPKPYNLFIGGYKDDDENYEFDGLIDEVRIYNKSLSLEEIRRIYSKNENDYLGKITISNVHASEPVYDVEVIINSSKFISTPHNSLGNTGYVTNRTDSSVTLFVPELDFGDSSEFSYEIYPVKKFPILFNTSTSNSRVMSGTSININDKISNVFENNLGQDGCLYNVSVDYGSFSLSGDVGDKVKFDSGSVVGSGAGFTTFAPDEYSFDWDINNGNCFNVSDNFEINYDVLFPTGSGFSGIFNISNSSLSFVLKDSFSGINVENIFGISNANISLEKEIVGFSNSDFTNSNVTWNVNSSFFTSSPLSYELNKATIWVSQKNVSGVYSDPNTIENDSISNSNLVQDYSLSSVVDLTTPWVSNNWNFNFSGFENPMVWFDVDFTLLDDGTQLQKSKSSESLSSTYVRGVNLITGYWLDINKSIKSIGEDKYNVNIVVVNKGSLSTPKSSVVTIYDLIPSNFVLNGSIVKSTSGWYNTDESSNPILGNLNGELYQWAIIPTNVKNVSLNFGAGFTDENSITINYNISGVGDYEFLDVFITGLDPQKVEGAGGSKAIVLFDDFLDEASNFWFGLVSLILVGLILIV